MTFDRPYSLRAALLGAVALVALGGAAFETSTVPVSAAATTEQPAAGPASFADVVDRVEGRGRLGQGQDRRRRHGRTTATAQPTAGLPQGRPAREFLPPVRHRLATTAATAARRAIALRHGAGLRLLHLRRRLHRHQQSRRRPRQGGDGHHRRRQDDAGQASIGTDPKTDLALLKVKEGSDYPYVSLRLAGAARRRLGDRGRQSVRPRRHGDGGHRLGARPRHRRRAL